MLAKLVFIQKMNKYYNILIGNIEMPYIDPNPIIKEIVKKYFLFK